MRDNALVSLVVLAVTGAMLLSIEWVPWSSGALVALVLWWLAGLFTGMMHR